MQNNKLVASQIVSSISADERSGFVRQINETMDLSFMDRSVGKKIFKLIRSGFTLEYVETILTQVRCGSILRWCSIADAILYDEFRQERVLDVEKMAPEEVEIVRLYKSIQSSIYALSRSVGKDMEQGRSAGVPAILSHYYQIIKEMEITPRAAQQIQVSQETEKDAINRFGINVRLLFTEIRDEEWIGKPVRRTSAGDILPPMDYVNRLMSKYISNVREAAFTDNIVEIPEDLEYDLRINYAITQGCKPVFTEDGELVSVGKPKLVENKVNEISAFGALGNEPGVEPVDVPVEEDDAPDLDKHNSASEARPQKSHGLDDDEASMRASAGISLRDNF